MFGAHLAGRAALDHRNLHLSLSVASAHLSAVLAQEEPGAAGLSLQQLRPQERGVCRLFSAPHPPRAGKGASQLMGRAIRPGPNCPHDDLGSLCHDSAADSASPQHVPSLRPSLPLHTSGCSTSATEDHPGNRPSPLMSSWLSDLEALEALGTHHGTPSHLSANKAESKAAPSEQHPPSAGTTIGIHGPGSAAGPGPGSTMASGRTDWEAFAADYKALAGLSVLVCGERTPGAACPILRGVSLQEGRRDLPPAVDRFVRLCLSAGDCLAGTSAGAAASAGRDHCQLIAQAGGGLLRDSSFFPPEVCSAHTFLADVIYRRPPEADNAPMHSVAAAVHRLATYAKEPGLKALPPPALALVMPHLAALLQEAVEGGQGGVGQEEGAADIAQVMYTQCRVHKPVNALWRLLFLGRITRLPFPLPDGFPLPVGFPLLYKHPLCSAPPPCRSCSPCCSSAASPRSPACCSPSSPRPWACTRPGLDPSGPPCSHPTSGCWH